MSILEPDSRTVYLSALRPPDGYALDRAVGTTYSLDLTTLLSVPLAFALFDRADTKEELLKDPVLLLEALRRYARRTTIFCNAGQIAAPRTNHALFVTLEPMVAEARAPNVGGVFHPKVWVLRFLASDAPVRYRVIVLTRNLTPDRSWDTVLTLEGDVTERERAFARNHPLADFVKTLPSLATTPIATSAGADMATVERELRLVDFELPEPFEDLAFWPLGIPGYRKDPFQNRDHRRALVISPFVRAATLDAIGGHGDDVLVARPEEMDALGAAGLSAFKHTFILCDAIEQDDAVEEPTASEPTKASPAGLHAKLFVLDHGWDSHVITGSANATLAALSRNVEFCVELIGKKSKVGIDALLGDGAASGISGLLQPYTPPAEPVAQAAATLQAEQRLEELRRRLVERTLGALVAPATTPDTFDLHLHADQPIELPDGVDASIRPVTLQLGQPLTHLAEATHMTWPGVSLLGLSAFFAVEAETKAGDDVVALRFVLRVPLEQAPDGREQAVLRSVVASRENLIRYLLLLLADELDDPALTLGMLSASTEGGASAAARSESSMPVLEHLLRAYARSPEKLDAIHRLVSDLRAHPESASLLPDGFERVWDPIWQARERARNQP